MAHGRGVCFGAISSHDGMSFTEAKDLPTMRTRAILPVTLLMGASLLAGCTAQEPASWTYPPTTEPQVAVAAPTHHAAPASSDAPAAPAQSGGTIDIKAFDLGFDPGQLKVPAAGRYTVNFSNTGTIPHDITFPGGEKASANAGETASVDVEVPAEGL